MAEVNLTTDLKVPVDAVWSLIADFAGIGKFVPAVADCQLTGEGAGSVRTLSLHNGATIVERLESLDSDTWTLSYSILESPLPVVNYLSRMQVSAKADGGCVLAWSSTFEPVGVEEKVAVDVIEGIYQMGFEGLSKLFSGSGG